MTELRPDFAHLTLTRIGDTIPVSGPAIVFACDDGFVFALQVALASIFLNSPSRSLDLVVFAFDWRDSTVAVLDRLAKKFGRPLTIIRVDAGALTASLAARAERRAGLFRLMIPEILTGDEFLYLDTDVVAQIDLDEIWQHDRNDMLVGGVADHAAKYWMRRYGFAEPDLYINSGVLLINGSAWRDERALYRCTEWIDANPDRRLDDQDAINIALGGRIHLLPDHWNVISINRPATWRIDPDTFRGIAHFAGFAKPWTRWCEPALQEFYLHYARVIGLPAGYWVESRKAKEAMAEAIWAEEDGNHAKANAIRKRVAEAALARLREIDPKATVDLLRQDESRIAAPRQASGPRLQIE